MASKATDIHQALIEGCRNADRKAQYKLYHLYAKQMYNVSMRIVNHVGEAEDILQESFVDAFRRIQEFRGEATFGSWLKRIVVNKSINSLRKKRMDLFKDAGRFDNLANEVDDDDDMNITAVRLMQLVGELPDGYRLVLTLHLFENYKHSEIAALLNISESTSKSQYNRAKARLREQLKKTEYAG
ncbi:MAG: RNA polymerase sigma factor [Sphingobacteriales bacterium]|nr:MAG: RNA polymerase sigma factor [Sphingobacteriales bacterium]